MVYEIPESFKPVLDTELPLELQEPSSWNCFLKVTVLYMMNVMSMPSNQFTLTSAPLSSAAKSSLLGSVSEVFRSWANLRVAEALTPRKQQIQDRIADTCRVFEGEDRWEDRYEDFDGDEYREFQSATRLSRYGGHDER